MSDAALGSTLGRLRAEFDATFARPPAGELEATEDLLRIRAGGRALAIRIHELAVVMRCPRLTALPSACPSLAGIAALRGLLVAVFDVDALLRRGPARESAAPGWFVQTKAEPTVALRFDEVIGYERVPRSSFGTAEDARDIVRIEGVSVAVLRISRMLEALRVATPPGDEGGGT